GKPRWTPPMPPVARTRMPAARAAASVPPTVVAPTASWTAAAARSRGPTLRASALNRASSSAASPTRTSPSRTPTVAGTPPAARVLQPGCDERLREAAAGQVGTHAEAEPHLVPFGDEVEEADELAVVVDDRPQVRSPARVGEQLDAPWVGRRVVPLVRELVPP